MFQVKPGGDVIPRCESFSCLWGGTRVASILLKVSSIIFIWYLFNEQQIRQRIIVGGGGNQLQKCLFYFKIVRFNGISHFFIYCSTPFPLLSVALQQSTVLTSVHFSLFPRKMSFLLGLWSEGKSKISPPSVEFSSYFPMNWPVVLWALNPGGFPRLIQASLSKGLCLSMCQAIR